MPNDPQKEAALAVGGDESAVKQGREVQAVQSGAASTAPSGGKIIRREPQTTGRPGLDELRQPSKLMQVTEDIWEEFYPEGVKRPLYRKLFAVGDVMLESEYERIVKGEPVAVHDVSLQVGGAEGRVGGTVEPKGPAKVGQRG